MDLVKIGTFLKDLRKEKNITQEELADKMGVSRRTVSRWETGSNLPDMDILIDISDFYEVDLREILDGERKDIKMDNEKKVSSGYVVLI
ncbi:MAG: helix-turn-helix transcriptional regulator, partial [Oscillospiraceae bacterium]|nr:helix-turn-helix transcriptional regulator [Oscillospiraceae bacterium]